MSNFVRFNRHEEFTNLDFELIDAVKYRIVEIDFDKEEIDRNAWRRVDNQLCGLYDGFLYNDLLSGVERYLAADKFNRADQFLLLSFKNFVFRLKRAQVTDAAAIADLDANF